MLEDDRVMFGHGSDAHPTVDRTPASQPSRGPGAGGRTVQLSGGPLALPPASPFPESGAASPRLERTAALAQPGALANVLPLAHLTLRCAFPTVAELHNHLRDVDLANPDRLRPKWETCVAARHGPR